MHSITAIPGFSEPVASLTHLAAALTFFCASFFLVARGRGNWGRTLALCLYSFGIVYLFSMSGVYHLLEPGGDPRWVLQRLDHSAIWVMIAGSFTPIHIILFRGFWRWGVLTIIWTVAITGLVLEAVFFTDFPEWLSLSFYLGLGWVGLFSGRKYMKHYNDHSARDMVFGGLSYSIGALLDFFRWPVLIPGVVGPHELFHVAVIMGAYFHWRFIYSLANMALKDRLTFIVKVRPHDRFFVKAVGENIKFKADSEAEIGEKIRESIHLFYRDYTRPKAIRLKYIREEFIDPMSPSRTILSGDVFYNTNAQ